LTAQKIINKGFTLIELLIVIAVLGVLAVVVLIAVNPLQQLARGRDAGRVSAIGQLGRSAEAYAVSNNGVYVAENATWIASLVTAGEISVVPSVIAYTAGDASACSTNAQNSYCYNATTALGGAPAIFYARLEADSSNSKCSGTDVAYTVFSTADGRGGLVCSTLEPGPGNQTFVD